MKSEILFEENDHKWVVIGRDPEKKESVIDTNEYLIINNNNAVLLDPGGIEIFPQVLTELTKYVDTDNIRSIVASHQDPDISSSLSMWLDLCPNVKVYCPWIWTGFIAHFGMGTNLTLNAIPDDGMELPIGSGNHNLYVVPAHYCHSSANFSTYDPLAGILFSGDIGAALLGGDAPMFVQDFDAHTKYMDLFHRRWMPSSAALRDWVKRVRLINPGIIAPQHGAIFTGENVGKLLDWLENLEVAKWDSGEEAADIRKAKWLKWKK